MKKTILLITIFFLLSNIVANSENNGWYRRNTVGYFYSYNLKSLVIGEIIKSNNIYNFGYGITLYRRLITKNNVVNNLFPVSICFAYPFFKNKERVDSSEFSDDGRIVVFPKYGIDQYSAALYLISRGSLIGYSYFEDQRVWTPSISVVAGFEKALSYQLSLCIEGGYTSYFIPSENISESVYFIGLSLNIFSKWSN